MRGAARGVVSGLAGLLAGSLPAQAAAHSLGKRLGDFYGGLLHPVATLEHALPIAALALLAGQQGARSGRVLLAVFPVALVVGLLAYLRLPELAWIDAVNLASFVLLGGLVAAAWRLHSWAIAALGIVFGLSHGFTHGAEVTRETSLLLFASGVGIGGTALVTVASAVAVALGERADWSRVGVRVAGSWVAAVGVLLWGLAGA